MKVVYLEHEYEVPEFDTLSFRETKTIKRVTGLRPGEWSEAFEQSDPDMQLAILVVALARAGVAFDEQTLLDSNAFTTIGYKAEEGEAEVVPPAEAGADVEAETPSEKPASKGKE